MASLQTFITFIAIIIFVYASYETRRKKHQLFCQYTYKDGTMTEKWVGIKSDYVIFDNKKFDILPDRIGSFWMAKGIHMFFPTRVNYARYSWDSRWPHDPKTYKHVIVSPRVRKIINKEELVESYYKTQTPTSAKKQTFMQQYGLFIVIGLVMLVAFYLYNNDQTIAKHISDLANKINALAPK